MISVMIVDDEKLMLEDLTTLIDWERCGFHIVATAFNGKQGLRKYQELHPQLILTDIRMPFMDGVEMIAQIRKTDPQVCIVLLTAYEEFEYAREAIRLGVAEYLMKSEITEETLRELLLRLGWKISPGDGGILGEHVMADGKRYSRPVADALEYIKRNYVDPQLSVNDIAAYTRLSTGYLSGVFKEEVGITLKNYITDIRITAAKKLMEQGNYKIYEICRAVGYHSSQYFSQAFYKKTGMLPTEYRRKE